MRNPVDLPAADGRRAERPPRRARPPAEAPSRAAPAASPRREVPWTFLSILLLGTGLRLPGLVTFPLEQDELYTILESRDLFHVRLLPGIRVRPLYFLLQHPLLDWLPVTAPALRLLPIVFGVLGILVTWRLATRLAGRTGGLVAALLVAISPWHMHASGMARYWSLVYLLAAGSYLLLVRAHETGEARAYFGALALLVLGSLTHPGYLFPLVGVAAALALIGDDGRPRWPWADRSAWFRLWLPYAGFLVLAFLALRLTGHAGALRNWSGRGWAADARLIPAIVEWVGPVVAALAFLGALVRLGAPRTPADRRIGAMLLLGPLAAALLLVLAAPLTDAYADYAIGILPLLYAAVGVLTAFVADLTRRPRATAAGAALLVVAASGPSALSHLSDGTRFDYRPAFAFVRATSPRLPMLAWPIIVAREYAPDLTAYELAPDPRRVDALLGRLGDLWVVTSEKRYGIVGDDDGRLGGWLRSRCALRFTSQRPRFDDRVYRIDVYRCAAGAPVAGQEEATP